MPRQTDSRERLLSVASELVWTQSYYGTSVDAICEKSGIKKGSFYHHFPSKEAVVLAALEADWQGYKQYLDAAFSPANPPVERLRLFAEGTYASQKKCVESYGRVLGCPLYALGAEIGTQEPALRAQIDEHLSTMERYFRATLTEAIREGLMPDGDVGELSAQALAYCEGSLTLARIRNDLTPLAQLFAGLSRLLGFSRAEAA